MSKKQKTRIRKFLRADARRLSPEAIEEIRNAQNNIPDAQRIMCKKHRIGSTTYQKIIDNQRPPEPTEEWCRIIESVSVSNRFQKIIRNLHMILSPLLIYKKIELFIQNIMQMMMRMI